MDAFVYLQIQPRHIPEVLGSLAATQGVRRAVAVVGGWDVLVHAEAPDLATIATVVLSELHHITGVVRTETAPVVPPDRIGLTGFGGPKPPPIVPNACYVHLRAAPGAAAGICERLGEMADVAGVAVLGGTWDLLTCIPQPWEVASGIILEQIHAIPGVAATKTLVSLDDSEREEDRDQFSAWN
jgi:hypothetical protein